MVAVSVNQNQQLKPIMEILLDHRPWDSDSCLLTSLYQRGTSCDHRQLYKSYPGQSMAYPLSRLACHLESVVSNKPEAIWELSATYQL